MGNTIRELESREDIIKRNYRYYASMFEGLAPTGPETAKDKRNRRITS